VLATLLVIRGQVNNSKLSLWKGAGAAGIVNLSPNYRITEPLARTPGAG
jgi:hypothetical protein